MSYRISDGEAPPVDKETFEVTPQQKRHFDTFGFVIFRGLMQDWLQTLNEEFYKVFDHFGVVNNFTTSQNRLSFIESSEKLSGLLDDSRVHKVAKALLGPEPNFMASSGNYYIKSTGWHSDVPLDPPWPKNLRSMNMSYYLDPVTEATGALRFMPGTHYLGETYTDDLTANLKNCKEEWGIEPNEVPAITLEIRPGDLLVFNNYSKHSSFGGGNNRRVILTNFARRYEPQFAHDLPGFHYAEPMLRTAGPERMFFLQQVLEAREAAGTLPELNERARAAYEANKKSRQARTKD